jgi:redox-sensitive bicupin YhaK (pirin superfamily)
MYKSIAVIAKASPAQVGDGFFIRRAMPGGGVGLGELSPFLVLDHAGPTSFAPSNQPKGVDEHPHRGFETVTIVYQGELEHRDSAGNSGRIGPGDVQWMTAASGLVHEEKHSKAFTQQGGTLEIIQLWVNLPATHKMIAPRYQEILASDIPAVPIGSGHSYVRVIAGEFQVSERSRTEKGPASTFTPLDVLDVRLLAGESLNLTLRDGDNTAVYALKGKVRVNDSDTVSEAEIARFDQAGDAVRLEALEDSTVLVLSGTPINEPIASYGPFVMNTSEEIRQAIQDYHTGKMGVLEAG